MNPIAVQNSIFPLQAYEIFLKLIYFKLLQEYWTYEWDLWNRLIEVKQHNAPDNGECVDVSYEYDALNHRTSRISKGETTKYAYGRNGALAYQEKTVDGNVTKRSFTYLNNEIVGFTDCENNEETAYYTVTDIQGSITEVYDNDSNLVWKSGYTAFGQLAGEVVDLIDFDGMYTGCDYDAETGLTYHWNRWRSEDGSVFISEDPARDGSNWYGYAGCNPMVYVDRIGLFYYTAEGQQSSTNTNQTATESSEKKNSEAPNVMGSTGEQTPPPVPNVETDGGNGKTQNYDDSTDTVDNWYDTVEINNEYNTKKIYYILTYFHFEGRDEKNVITESFEEILDSAKNNGNWKLLKPEMSIYHQNGFGTPELKFICEDGREAVFTKDFSEDGSYQLYTDPRYKGTYNYCNPEGFFGCIGHFFADMVPYYLTGDSNERNQ